MQYNIKNKLYILTNILIVVYGVSLFIDWKVSRAIIEILLILWIITGDYKEKIQKIINNKITISFLLFLLLFLVGLLWTEDMRAGLHIIKYPMLYLIVPIIISMYRKEYIKWYKYALIGTLVFTGILTLLIQIGILDMGYNPDEAPFINRVYLGIMLVFAYGYFISEITFKLNMKNIFLFLFSLLMIYSVIISASRMALINIVIVSLLIVFYKYKFTIKIVFLTIILSIIISFLTYSYSNTVQHVVKQTINSINKFDFQEQIINKKHELRTSLNCRFEFWYYAYEIGNKYPILGAGTGDGILELEKLIGKEESNLLFKECNGSGSGQFNPHNLFIFMYMQFGLVGLLLLFYMLYIQLSVAIKSKYLPFIILVVVTITSMFSLSLLFTSMYFIPFYAFSMITMYLVSQEKKLND